MKNMVKKNQVMITALALMIAVAGYLNFAGNRITQEEICDNRIGHGRDREGNRETLLSRGYSEHGFGTCAGRG